LGQAIASGASPQFRAGHDIDLDHSAFISGLNTILLVSAFVLFAGAILAFVLVRQQDFVESSAEAVAASG
jgi:hypothetical protein